MKIIIQILILAFLLIPGNEIKITTKNCELSYESNLLYKRLKNAFRRNKKDDKK